MKTAVGIIGFGRLGRLLTRHFAKDFRIAVCDVDLDTRLARKLGARSVSFTEACACDVVIPCVPIGAFEGVARRMSGLLGPGTLVIDVCSVMEHPVRVMKRLLPKSVELLATHPNFGPDSAAESLRGHKVVFSKVRISSSRFA